MKTYLTNLIEEKGRSTSDDLNIDGHIGLTYDVLIEFICNHKEFHKTIRSVLVKIDFNNGDVFHYLLHLAKGMIKAAGY